MELYTMSSRYERASSYGLRQCGWTVFAESFCPMGSKKPILCPPNRSSVAGSAECSRCPPGKYLPENSTYTLTACETCPVGHKCEWEQWRLPPVLCPPTTFSVEGATLCQTCPPGQFTNASGQALCYTCPKGHMCSQGTSVCTAFSS